MDAKKGDRIVVEGNQVGQPRREGEVVEVIHGSSGRHYRVRWDGGDETIYFPSSDARVDSGTR